MSLCAVASSTYEDKKASIYEMMRQYKKSNAMVRHLSKLMWGAKWVNRMISALA